MMKMKKKWLALVAAVLLVAFAVPAFAAITDAQKKEILDLQKQIVELRKKMIDKYVEAGQLTPEQGKLMKDRMDQMEKYREQNGILPGPGMMQGGGCGGFGFGANGGFGGPMMRGGWGVQTQGL
ncbi:hypothetical protein JDF658_10730 [Carboxydocella sp. JDF658]|nr:hypothetical protein JDF658_10730 [Carboxydocella sp. JDF658]